MTDRRPIIQKYLPPGWDIIKPTPDNPGYIDDLCIFQKADGYKEARANLPVRWFDDKEWARIEQEIQRAIKQANIK